MWFDTPVQFLFFAIGAMISLLTRGRSLVQRPSSRALCVLLGVVLLLTTGAVCIMQATGSLSLWRFYVGYGATGIGCSTRGNITCGAIGGG